MHYSLKPKLFYFILSTEFAVGDKCVFLPTTITKGIYIMSQYRKLTWRHQLLRSVRLILEDYGGVAELDHIKKIVLVRQYELASSKKILNASKAEEQNLRLEACNLDELLDNLPEERW